MTKIKNTKKGMAKKTLSMSLVVAMLATSNVPVWAAEFSDGSDAAVATEAPAAEAFSDETAEAPVVDDTTADTATANTVIEEGDLKINLTTKKEVTWGDKITVSGSITNTETNNSLDKWNFGVREAGTAQAITTKTDVTKVDDMEYTTEGKDAGKTLELYIYRDDASASFGPIVIGTVKVNKKDIKGATIQIKNVADNTAATMTYNGRVQNAASVDKIMLGTTELKPDDRDITVSSAVNAGDILTVTVTAKGDKYCGSATRNIKIIAKDYVDKKDIIAKVKDDVKYEYTGLPISLKASDVTVEESKHDADVEPDDGKLGGADLSAAIESVTTEGSNYGVGKHQARVKLETGKLDNFDFKGDAYKDVVTTDTYYEVVARDLSKVNVVVGSNGEVQLGEDADKLLLNFYAGSQYLKLGNTTDYTYIVKDPEGKTVTGKLSKEGTYTVEITAKENGNAKNSVSATFRVEGNVIDYGSSTGGFGKYDGTGVNYTKDYTGNAIQPTKDDIGTVTIKGENGQSVPLQKGEWEIVGYSNNTEASTYGNAGVSSAPYNYTRRASVQIKVTQSGTFYGKTCNLYFNIAPLKVTGDTITVPKTTSYDKANKKASDYKLDVTVKAKDSNGKTVAVPVTAYTTTSKFVDANGKDAENGLDTQIQTTVVLKDHNYIYVDKTNDYDTNGKTQSVKAGKTTTIKAPVLTNASVVLTQDSYTYTGGKITPSFKVMDGTLELQEGVDYKVKNITDAVNVGTGTITVEGLGTYYSGEASATFKITPAKVEDVKVTASKKTYTGKKIKPTDFTATLNGNDVSDQFKLSAYGDNTNAGKTAGSLTIALLSGNKNFTGSTVDGTFEIEARKVQNSTISVYDKYGQNVNNKYDTTGTYTLANPLKTFTYDGKEQKFASAKLNVGDVVTEAGENASNIVKPTADDFDLVYVDNVYGKSETGKSYNVAHVYAVAKAGGNYKGTSTITTADGTVIKNVVADLTFGISALKFVKENVSRRCRLQIRL